MLVITKAVLISVVALSVTSCTGRIVHMENDQGAHITCEVSMGSAMMTGVLVRDGTIDNCVRDKETAGFKVVGEN